MFSSKEEFQKLSKPAPPSLASVREGKGLTLKQVAVKVGVEAGTVKGYESSGGGDTMHLEPWQLVAYMKVLELSPIEFLRANKRAISILNLNEKLAETVLQMLLDNPDLSEPNTDDK